MERPAPRPGDDRELRLALLGALAGGDAPLAFRLVVDLMDEGYSLEAILVDLLAPVSREVGERWSHGDLSVADEHAATGALETVVAMLAGSFAPPPDAPTLVCACPEGEQHALAARIVAVLLADRDYAVTYLGASIPAPELGTFLAEARPEALVLSCSVVTALAGARRVVQAAHAVDVPVLAGGRALGSDDRRARALGADAWAPDVATADRLLRSWAPAPAVAEAELPDADPERAVLEHRWVRWVERAVDALGDPGPDRARTRADLGLLVAALDAALLTTDPDLLADYVHWLDATLAARGVAPGAAGPLLRVLADAAAPDAPGAAELLRGSS